MIKNKKIILATSITVGLCICTVGFLFIGIGVLSQGIVDCGWEDTASAWVDENQNGLWDNHEKPLAKVQFLVDDIRHNYDTSGEAISNVNGEAGVYVFPVVCTRYDEIEIVIKANPPKGYESTTPSEVSVPRDKAENGKHDNFPFGFIEKD